MVITEINHSDSHKYPNFLVEHSRIEYSSYHLLHKHKDPHCNDRDNREHYLFFNVLPSIFSHLSEFSQTHSSLLQTQLFPPQSSSQP
mmetsp:Transcript_40658/g.79536  ORF Transcript_40658/g.79536 Transcript_40658/m.79536 type:complete len:87 (-) Transcript_40658:225-485(-)